MCVYVCLCVCVCVCVVCVCVCVCCVCVCASDMCECEYKNGCLCPVSGRTVFLHLCTTLRVGPCDKICTYSFVDCISQQHKHHPLCVTLPLFVCPNTSASDGQGDEERVWPPPFDRSH